MADRVLRVVMDTFTETVLKLPENVLLALLLVYAVGRVADTISERLPRTSDGVNGVLFGVAAALCMSLAHAPQPGVIIDLRNLIVFLAGPFAGPVAAGVAAAVAAAWRLFLGGVGTWPAVGALATAAAGGALVWKVHGRLRSWPAAALAGAGLAVTTTPWLLAVGDAETGHALFLRSVLPLTLFYVLGAVALALLLTHRERGRAERMEQAADMRRLRGIADTAYDWSWAMGPDLRFTEVVPGANVADEVRRSEFVGKRPRDLLVGASESEIETHEETLARRLPFRDVVYGYRTPAGDAGALAVSGAPIFKSDGTFDGYHGSGRDVTEEERRRDELLQAANTDSLTGLPNRRSTELVLGAEIERVRRYNRKMSLIWVDVDRFKQINDRYGHGVGDTVLRDVTAAVRARLRRNDVFGRWGGDEFLIILPEQGRSGAEAVAETLRQQVEGLSSIEGVTVTLSFGIAEYDGHASVEELLEAADKALYQAKTTGRNAIVVADLPDPPVVSRDWSAQRR